MTIRVFVSGQSNALGRGTGGPNWSGIDSRVRVWDNANPLGANGTAWRTAALARSTYSTFQFTDRNNFGVWFCHRLAQIADDDVDMTIVARGGTLLEEWAPGSPLGMLEECDAVWTATGQAPADVFLWMQGEGDDQATSAADYKTAFLSLLSNLTSAGVIDANTTVIMGELFPRDSFRTDFNSNVLASLASENANIFVASNDGLESYDDTHYGGQSLYAFGVDGFFAAYQEAQGTDMADLYAFVNEGGTPGVAGTGINKTFNLTALAEVGLGSKDITLSPDYAGIPPGDDLMTAGMLAAGALVEWGVDVTNGTYFRFESGLQICFHKMILPYLSAAALQATWTFPKTFNSSAPTVFALRNGAFNNGASTSKRYGAWLQIVSESTTTAAVGLLKPSTAPDPFASGDSFGVNVFALGFWKS